MGNVYGMLPRNVADQVMEVPLEATENDQELALNEIAIANEFVSLNASRIRYVAEWGTTLFYDCANGVWRTDLTLQLRDEVREHIQCVGTKLEGSRKAALARSTQSEKTVAAVTRLVQAYRAIAATTDQWDADPWLLNTPGGVYNLRSGEKRPHDPLLYLSKSTSVAPSESVPADCLWLKFLNRIFDQNQELVGFIKRALGYTLTGLTREEVLFFLYGLGGNGKSKFLDAIAQIVAAYHEQASMDTFTQSKHEQHPADLAKLRGARFVTASESEAGRRWAEAKLKSITGGDPISARFMRQNFFTYRPQLKLWVASNHKPQLRNVDEAMRRRMMLVPFSVTIPPEERDKDLSEKLKAEWPIILRWMIDGCMEWQDIGLRPPEAVRAATDAYLAEEDALGNWMNDCCIRDRHSFTSSDELWGSWKAWAEQSGESQAIPNKKRLGQSLTDRGLMPDKERGKRGYKGIQLLKVSET